MSRLRVYIPNTSTELPVVDAKWTQRRGESDELTFRYPADGPSADLLFKPQQLELRASNGVDVLRTFTVSSFLPPRSRVYGEIPVLEITARARSLDELLDTVITEYPVMFVLNADLPLPETWDGGFASQVATVLAQPEWETLQWGVGDVIADVFGAAHVSRARINNEIVKPTVLQGATSLLLTRKQPGVYVDRSWVGGGDAEGQYAGSKLVFQHNLKTHLRNILWYFQDKETPGGGAITLGDVTFTGYDANEFYEFHLDGMSIREALDVIYTTAGRPGIMYIDDNGALQWANKSGLQTWTLLYGEENLREYRATPNYERLVTRVYAIGGEVDGERVRLQAPVDRNTATYGVIETTLTFDDALNTEELTARADAYLDEYAEPQVTYDLVAWEGDTPRRPGHSIRLRDLDYSLDVTEPIVERVRTLDSPLCTYRIGAEPVALEEILENVARSRRMARDTYFEPSDTGDLEIPPELLAHLSDTGNPHDVTKAQVGLEYVDNYQQVRAPATDPTNHTIATWQDRQNLRTGSVMRSWTETSGDNAATLDTVAGRNIKIRAGHDGTLAHLYLASGPGGQLRLQHYLATHAGVAIVGDTVSTVRHSFSQGGAAVHYQSVGTPKWICPADHTGDMEIYSNGKKLLIKVLSMDMFGASIVNSKADADLRFYPGATRALRLGGLLIVLEGLGESETPQTVTLRVRADDDSPDRQKLLFDAAALKAAVLECIAELATDPEADRTLTVRAPEGYGDLKLEFRNIILNRTFPDQYTGANGGRITVRNDRGDLYVTNTADDAKVVFGSEGGVWDGTHKLGHWAPYTE